MARADNDGVIGRIVVNRIDVRPVAAFARTNDIAELITRFKLCKICCRHRLAGLRRINVEADSTLVEHLHNVVTIRIQDLPETPFIDNLAVLIDFSDYVANGMDTLAVGTAVVRARNTDERMTVLCIVERMREIRIADRKTAVVNLTPHQVVLDIALTVTPGEVAVLILLEPHHDAGVINGLDVVDRFNVHVPAHFALRVDNGILRIEVPLHRTAHRIVPNCARGLGVLLHQIVDEIKAVGELRINLSDLRLKHIVMKTR